MGKITILPTRVNVKWIKALLDIITEGLKSLTEQNGFDLSHILKGLLHAGVTMP